MSVVYTVASRTLPLYALIVLGYLLGKRHEGAREILADLLIYFVSPIVIAHGILHSELGGRSLALAPLMFIVCCALSTAVYHLSKLFWSDSTRNILAFTAGTGNTGYFGLPVSIVLFGEEAIAPAVIAGLGVILYENSLGYYYAARGHFTARDCLRLVVRMPALYAVLIVSALKYGFHVEPNHYIDDVSVKFVGTYSVLGMMLIGVGLSRIESFAVDWKFLSSSLFVKFIVWPVVIGSLVSFDSWHLGYLSRIEKSVLLMLSCCPLAALTVAFAARFKAQPEKAAFAVLVSTILSMVVIPVTALFLATPM